MIQLLLLFALTLPLIAEDTKPLATVEELTKQVAEQQKDIELLKADNAWLEKYFFLANSSVQACMGQRPSQAQRPRPMEKR